MQFKILLVLVYVCITNVVWGQTQVIAHRGYWKAEKSAENSVTALKLAAEQHVYGSEFDVHLTADSVMVVNHDNHIQGLKIADMPYSTLRDKRLRNGEPLPTLKKYLLTGKSLKGLKLILEVKPQDSQEKENLMALLISRMVKKYELENQVEYISFSLNFCKRIVKLCPNSQVAYLGSNLSPKEVNQYGISIIDYHYKTFIDNPAWIKEAHDLGMKVNAWTVNDENDMQKMINLHVDFLTTDCPVEALNLIDKYKELKK